MGQKEKRELFILVIGVVLLIASWKVTHRAPKSVAQKELITQAPIETTITEEESVREVEPVSEIKYTGRENRDPLDNSAVVKERGAAEPKREKKILPGGSISITGIIWGSKRPQAIINGKIVDIGETIDGGRIIGIDKKGVHIDFDGEEVLLIIK